MKKTILFFLFIPIFALVGCDTLDTMEDTYITQEDVENQYANVVPMGYASYSYMQSGLSELDNNLAAAKSDEAVHTSPSAQVRIFNNGSWSAYTNPDNRYEAYYRGIRAANYFLDYSTDYKNMLAHNRDTLSSGTSDYRRDVTNVGYLRAEQHVLKAYYYFELIKRYGGVPLYMSVPDDKTFLPRAGYDEVVEYIVSEIDYAMDSLANDWSSYDAFDGRFNKGAGSALKARVLLYAASPLNTAGLSETETSARWQKATVAAHDVITMNKYSLWPKYDELFKTNTASIPEILMSLRSGTSNSLERENYPIATAGGNSGLTPSQNLVDAYEYTAAADPANPYDNRDPRLNFTIVTNNSLWNGRMIDISENGTDSYKTINASRTGYYLKKYLADELQLTQGGTSVHYWVYFRYAEVLLNYAEAANEVWGPDATTLSSGLTAREALNQVRSRVNLAPIDLSRFKGANVKEQMRNAVKAERRVELAFEDHRYWDLLRWRNGEVLASPITGVVAASLGTGAFSYRIVQVENRSFDANKMYRYPIPFDEVSKSEGIVKQNPNW